MAKKVKVVSKGQPIEEYGDEGIVTRDRDLTNEEIQEIYDRAREIRDKDQVTPVTPLDPTHHKKGNLMLKCGCGRIAPVTEEIIEDGLSWSMIIGNDHYLTLHCDECESKLTMYIQEITDDELSEEGNKE